MGLVHMGGRVYDPILGRFLQADPFIQQPNNTQNLNRYSYVLNNPLNATDPSGYFFQMLVMWAVNYIATSVATGALATALGYALTAYSYYGYAQMAVGAIRAIEGGGTAMANFAGGMAKGFAKGMLFNGIMLGLSHLQNGANTNSPDAAKPLDNTQGSDSADGHKVRTQSGKGNATYLDADGRKALDASLETINEKISNLGYFSSREEAAAWLHDNAFSITETHGAEIYAGIFSNAEGISIGNITTSYHTGYVGSADMALSKSFKLSSTLVADWHTHPAPGASNFSQADYQTKRERYVSFKDYHKPPGLRRYDGIKAWNDLGYNRSPAMPDMSLEHGDKYSVCISKRGC